MSQAELVPCDGYHIFIYLFLTFVQACTVNNAYWNQFSFSGQWMSLLLLSQSISLFFPSIIVRKSWCLTCTASPYVLFYDGHKFNFKYYKIDRQNFKARRFTRYYYQLLHHFVAEVSKLFFRAHLFPKLVKNVKSWSNDSPSSLPWTPEGPTGPLWELLLYRNKTSNEEIFIWNRFRLSWNFMLLFPLLMSCIKSSFFNPVI